jgi:hypothetical protein
MREPVQIGRRALRKIFPNNQRSTKLISLLFQRNLERKKCGTPINMGNQADSTFIEDRGADKYGPLA